MEVVVYEMSVAHTITQRVVLMEPGAVVENAARARGRLVGNTDALGSTQRPGAAKKHRS